MFSNLSTGSIIYVLDTKDGLKLTTGQINNVTPPRPKLATFNPAAMYGQNMELVVDITATVDGEKREFKQVPSNSSIANFGPDTFTIADSKETIDAHINSIAQNSEAILGSIEKHKKIIEDCKAIHLQLNPSIAAQTQRDNAMANLETKFDDLSNKFEMLMSVLNKETPKT